jgi:hypothetical protein
MRVGGGQPAHPRHTPIPTAWEAERATLTPLDGRPPYPFAEEELRKVARDAFVSWNGSRYSVPWEYAGKDVWVRSRSGDVEGRYGSSAVTQHASAPRKHMAIRKAGRHEGIPLGARQEHKTLVHIRQAAPMVEIRSLAAYESVAVVGVCGGGGTVA